MHFKPHALGLAFGTLSGLGYLLDAAFHHFFPEESLNFYSYITFNVDFTALEGPGLTWASFFAGLVAWVVMGYVCGAVFGWLYNKFSK